MTDRVAKGANTRKTQPTQPRTDAQPIEIPVPKRSAFDKLVSKAATHKSKKPDA